MKKLLVAMVVFFFMGCAVMPWAPVVPPQGAVFSQTSAPISTNFYDTTTGLKVGKSTVTSILGLVAFGDASINTAAKNGNINKIKYVDYDFLNVLGVFSQFTIKVYGE